MTIHFEDWPYFPVMFITITTMIVFSLVLQEFRFSFRKTMKIWLIGAPSIYLFNVLFVLLFGYKEGYLTFWPLTVTLPCVSLLLFTSKYKGGRFLFNIATILFVGTFNVTNGKALLHHLGSNWVESFSRLATFVLLFFFIWKIREPYLRIMNVLKSGWLIISSIPLSITIISIIILYFFPNPYSVQIVLVLNCLYLVGFLTYLTIYYFFNNILKSQESLREAEMHSVQLTALQNQVELFAENRRTTEILRHDMRHEMQMIDQLVQQGHSAEALKVLTDWTRRMDESKPVIYCENYIVNAVVSLYVSKAVSKGIRVNADLAIPQEIGVESSELAVVLSNALENALHACEQLAQGEERVIHLSARNHHKQLVIEVKNPCLESVVFDKNGLPLTAKTGHGIGSISILAFAKKHNAILDYECANGTFIFRLLLQL